MPTLLCRRSVNSKNWSKEKTLKTLTENQTLVKFKKVGYSFLLYLITIFNYCKQIKHMRKLCNTTQIWVFVLTFFILVWITGNTGCIIS